MDVLGALEFAKDTIPFTPKVCTTELLQKRMKASLLQLNVGPH